MSHRSPWTTAELVMLAVAAGELKPGAPPSRPRTTRVRRDHKLALKVLRRHVTRARARLADAEEKLALAESLPAPPLQRGPEVGNLTGQRLGSLVVVGYLCSSGATPWWLCECASCGTRDAYRGNALRARGWRVACRTCGAL